MTYSIFATNLVGAVTLERETTTSALKKAQELRRDGMWNIRIADDEGHWVEEPEIAPAATQPH